MNEEKITRAMVADGKVLIEQPDGSFRPTKGKTDWARVNALTDEEIEAAAKADPDAGLLDEEFWKKAQVVMPHSKRHQGMRLDVEVIEWFKAQGPGWQTRMNAVLKSYVEVQKRHPKP